MKNHINCGVKNCKFNNNSTGDCSADQVSVSNCGLEKTETSVETMCSTFSPKK
ncbi:MAG: DUF1540 domain-containing protein [Clostridia bacterium]